MIIITGALTMIACFVLCARIGERILTDKKALGVFLFAAVTALFGVATFMGYSLDAVLYPIRLLVVLFLIYIFW